LERRGRVGTVLARGGGFRNAEETPRMDEIA
jgi:hypothetical protein